MNMPLYFRFVTKTEILKKSGKWTKRKSEKFSKKKVKNVQIDILSEVLKKGYITIYNFICPQ